MVGIWWVGSVFVIWREGLVSGSGSAVWCFGICFCVFVVWVYGFWRLRMDLRLRVGCIGVCYFVEGLVCGFDFVGECWLWVV